MLSRKARRLLSLDVILEEEIYSDNFPSHDSQSVLLPEKSYTNEGNLTNLQRLSESIPTDAQTDSTDISWEGDSFVSRSEILRKSLRDLQQLLESCTIRLDNMVSDNIPMKRHYGSSVALHKINDLSQGNNTRSLRKLFEPSAADGAAGRGRAQHRRLERTSSGSEHYDMRRSNSVYKLSPSYEAPEMRRSMSLVSMCPPSELEPILEVPTSRIPVKVPPQTMPKPNRIVMEAKTEQKVEQKFEAATPRECLLRDIRSFGGAKNIPEPKVEVKLPVMERVKQEKLVQLVQPVRPKTMVDKQTQTLVDKETQTTDTEMILTPTEKPTVRQTSTDTVEPPREALSVRQISQVFNGSPKSPPPEEKRVSFSPSPPTTPTSTKPIADIQEKQEKKSPTPCLVSTKPTVQQEVEKATSDEELPKKDTVKNARSMFENGSQAQPLVFDAYGTHKKSPKAGSVYNSMNRTQSPCTNRTAVSRANSAPATTTYKTPIHWPTFKETNQMGDKSSRTSWKAVSPRDGYNSSRSFDTESFCSEEISDATSDIDSELSYNSRHDSFYDRNDTDYRYIPRDVLERIRSYGMTMTFFGSKVTIDDHLCVDTDDDADNFSLIEEEITKKQPVSRTNSAQSPRIISCIPKEEPGRKRHSSGESASSGVSSGHAGSDQESPQNSPYTSLKRSSKNEKSKKQQGQSVVFNLKKSFVI